MLISSLKAKQLVLCYELPVCDELKGILLIKYDVADLNFIIFILQHFVFVVDFHFSYIATRDV